MRHLDLFSGIGGFALAIDEIWPRSEHIFCDNDEYCQKLLKLRFPDSKIYGDIRDITDSNIWQGRSGNEFESIKKTQQESGTKNTVASDTSSRRREGREVSIRQSRSHEATCDAIGNIDIITGGFPCQPFSQAGKRKGTDDDRYLWPEMLRVIQMVKPKWVIAENVRGLITQERGVVLENICLNLENEGYAVQPFIIPAVAVNAPHRRDRIWIIANRKSGRIRGGASKECGVKEWAVEQSQPEGREIRSKSERRAGNPTNSKSKGLSESGKSRSQIKEGNACRRGFTDNDRSDNASDTQGRESREQAEQKRWKDFERGGWERNWPEVAAKLCGVDDGLPSELDGLKLSKSRHKIERLKSLGNAIVPWVAIEIMRAIKEQG